MSVRPRQKEIIKQSFPENSRQGWDTTFFSVAALGFCPSVGHSVVSPFQSGWYQLAFNLGPNF